MRPRSGIQASCIVLILLLSLVGLPISNPRSSPIYLIGSGMNQPPVAMGGNNTEEEPGKLVFFSPLGSYDPDGIIVLYQWDFQGDGIFDWNSTENGTTEYSYEEEGVYNATLQITDDNNTSSTHVHYVFILEKDDNGDTDYDRIIAFLIFVGIIEIAAGVGIFAVLLYLKRKLYDVL